VRGISEDKKSVETTAYVGSLVGATRAIVLATLSRSDYVRVKIAIKSECKIPEVAKGAILPYLYDFYYEREMEVVPNAEEVAMEVTSGQGEKKSADDKSSGGVQEGRHEQTNEPMPEGGKGNNLRFRRWMRMWIAL
jgi:hypothetical protein